MDHAKSLREPEQTLGVADEEIATRVQAMPELVDEALLLGFVKVDHDVAAENDVIAAGKKFGFEIVEVELDEFFELRLDRVLVAGFFEVAETRGVIDGLHLDLGIDPFLAGKKAGVADV